MLSSDPQEAERLLRFLAEHEDVLTEIIESYGEAKARRAGLDEDDKVEKEAFAAAQAALDAAKAKGSPAPPAAP